MDIISSKTSTIGPLPRWSFPIHSTCANCSRGLTLQSVVTKISIQGTTISIFEGLELIFKSRETPQVDEIVPSLLKMCTSCGTLFGKLLVIYKNFLAASVPSSFVDRLVNGTKAPQETHAHTEEDEDEILLEFEAVDGDRSSAMMDRDPLGDGSMYDDVSISKTSPNATTIEQRLRKKQKVTHHHPQSRLDATESEETDSEEQQSGADYQEDDHQFTARRKDALAKRQKYVPRRGSFNCEKCDETFAFKNLLKVHEMVVHEGKTPFECSHCSKAFYTNHLLRLHTRQAHPDKFIKIREPNEKIELTEEERSLIAVTDYRCRVSGCENVCLATFKEWILHQHTAHQVKTGYTEAELEQESITPKSGAVRPCPHCGCRIRSDSLTLRHVQAAHLKVPLFVCDICGKHMGSRGALSGHIEGMHGTQCRDFLCTLCGASFKQKDLIFTPLEIHEKTHLGQIKKSFKCETCGTQCVSRSSLTYHKKSVHSDERPFKCDVCGNTFKAQPHLDYHKYRIHVKKLIVDEICEFCGKGYAFKIRLKEHLMSIHKLSKEAARISSKSRPASLFRVLPNGDRVVHEPPTKPKTCSICDRTYVRREQLFTHLISVHGKTEEEAKEITGLESKRNLLPGKSRT